MHSTHTQTAKWNGDTHSTTHEVNKGIVCDRNHAYSLLCARTVFKYVNVSTINKKKSVEELDRKI